MIILVLLGSVVGFAIIRCLISHILSSFSTSVQYVQITTVEEDLGVVEPCGGGVRDEPEVTIG